MSEQDQIACSTSSDAASSFRWRWAGNGYCSDSNFRKQFIPVLKGILANKDLVFQHGQCVKGWEHVIASLTLCAQDGLDYTGLKVKTVSQKFREASAHMKTTLGPLLEGDSQAGSGGRAGIPNDWESLWVEILRYEQSKKNTSSSSKVPEDVRPAICEQAMARLLERRDEQPTWKRPQMSAVKECAKHYQTGLSAGDMSSEEDNTAFSDQTQVPKKKARSSPKDIDDVIAELFSSVKETALQQIKIKTEQLQYAINKDARFLELEQKKLQFEQKKREDDRQIELFNAQTERMKVLLEAQKCGIQLPEMLNI